MELKCDAYTANGTVCGKTAKRLGLCARHGEMKKAPHRVSEPEPWTLRSLPAPWVETSALQVQRIRQLLRAGPPAKDVVKKGWLYAYRLDKDRRDMWKSGSTEREPRERLREWRLAHKPHFIVELRVWHASEAYAWIERLLHRFMNYRRIARYDTGDGVFADYWYDTDEAVDERDEKLRAQRTAMHKHVEWFWVRISEIEALAKAVLAVKWEKK